MKPINVVFAARMEALRIARNAVRRELKSAGVKVSYVEQAEIQRQAAVWFNDHRAELMQHSLREVLRHALRANLSSAAQHKKAHPARVSSERMSGAK